MAKKTINVIYKVDDKELGEAKKTISGVEKEAKDADDAVKKFGNSSKKAGGDADKAFSLLKKTIATVSFVALAKQAFDFGKVVVQITSEFQKFEAVLINTLGSRSAAMSAMAMIKQFAASTPFSVAELTASYVKLANQGFKPTQEEMRKLGDLASANGKTFDMLTEAIIDGQTGEFERLKEFGIRASKEGDRVTFSFKGVETQTKFNSAAIRDYILSLGDLSGVAGGMAAISETLGGKISNMGDAWETFMVTLGDGQKGPLKTAIQNLTLLIEYATEFVESTEQARERLANIGAGQAVEKFKGLAQAYTDVNQAKKDYIKFLEIEYNQAFKNLNAVAAKQDVDAKELEQANLRLETARLSIIAVEDYVSAIEKTAKPTHKYGEEAKAAAVATKEFKDELEEIARAMLAWDELQNKLLTTPVEVIANFDSEIIDQMDAAAEKDARRRIQREKDVQEQILQARQYAFDASLDLIGQLLLAEDNRLQLAIDKERETSNRQIELAGDNERRKKEIRIESDARIADLQKQQAEREKQQVIKRIIIESALNAVKALGTPPVPNYVLAGVTLGFGLAQAAVVRSQGFAEGVIDLKGAGTTKSDSIPARLSRGESVITAEATASSRNLLEAIQDRKIDDSILTKMAKGGGAQVNVFDDSRLIKAIEKNKVNVSREAYTLYETRQMGKNLRVKVRSKIQGY